MTYFEQQNISILVMGCPERVTKNPRRFYLGTKKIISPKKLVPSYSAPNVNIK